MAHAHPLPDGLYLPPIYSQDPRRASNNASTITSFAVHTPQRRASPLSSHNRRLQLRNVGFRGPVLPARRVSPFFGSTALGSDIPTAPVNGENTPRAVEKRSLFGEDLSPHSTSILQEISNSTRRTRDIPRQAIIGIFEDATATSWLEESSNNPSPSSYCATPAEMTRLREMTTNEKVPSSGSPLARSANGRRTARVVHRSPSFESTKYIDHLESELASLHSKLDALTSPTTTRAQGAKLRGLNSQVRILRQEISQWESKYEERVADAIYQQSEINSGMKMRVRKLERENEAKETKIRELERELESAQKKLRDADSLESTNLNLEHRVEVLTELLAQSPTRIEPRSSFASPTRTGSAQRTPRPKSMLIRMPSSPSVTRQSSFNGLEHATWNPMSPTKIPEDHVLSPLSQRQSWPDGLSIGAMLSESTGSVSDVSAYHTSAPSTSSSRPTSMISTSSATSWGPPWTANSCDEQRPSRRNSRMRRFPSNNVALKPLILPTAVALPSASISSSAPAGGSYHTPYQNISNESTDPTTAFLSKHESNSSLATPTPPTRSQSVTAISTDRSKRPDGKPELKLDTAIASTPSTPGSITCVELRNEESEGHKSGSLKSHNRKRKSLQLELEEAKESLRETSKSPSPSPSSAADHRSQSATCEHVTDHPKIDLEAPVIEGSISKPVKRRRRHSSLDVTKLDSIIVSPQKIVGSPIISLLRQPTGLFAKLASLIASLKQDPLNLARRILINAWRCKTSRLAGMGWWLLGLLFNSRQKWETRNWAAADVAVGEEETNNSRRSRNISRSKKFDWQYYSAEASTERIIRQYMSPASDPGTSRNGKPSARGLSDNSSAATELQNWTHKSLPAKCKDCVEPPSRRSIRLWLRFSLAVILAIGVAIKDGPGVLLVDFGRPTPLQALPLCTCGCGLGVQGRIDSGVPSTPRQEPKRRSQRRIEKQSEVELAQSPEQSPAEKRDDGNWSWESTFTDPVGLERETIGEDE